MKIIISLCFFLLGASVFALEKNDHDMSKDYIIQEKSNELIVSFEHYNPKQLSELQAQLSTIPGIKQLGFCEKMHVFYFEYDASVYRSIDQAFDAILLNTKTFQPLIKIGSSIEQVQIECTK